MKMARSILVLAGSALVTVHSQVGQAEVYRFSEEADQLQALFFPERITVTGESRAIYQDPSDLDSVRDVVELHSQAQEFANRSLYEKEIDRDYLDSYYLLARSNPTLAANVESVAAEAIELAEHLLCQVEYPAEPLEQALFQRDVYQMFMIVNDVYESTNGHDLEVLGARLATLWRNLAFSRDRYGELRGQIVRHYESAVELHQEFRSEGGHSIASVDYWDDWLELPYVEKKSLHFGMFRGRSFFKVFLRIPGRSKSEMFSVWTNLYERFGPRLFGTLSGVPEVVPGTETAIVRTIGLLLADGNYVDSGIIETIRIRRFKYPAMTLDWNTSDYLGTSHVNFHLLRRAFLEDPASAGLTKVADDERAFYGLFGTVPNPDGGATLTTVRTNCVTCHSQIQYGYNSVFTLGTNPEFRKGAETSLEDGRLRILGESEFRLDVPPFSKALELAGSADLGEYCMHGNSD
jgi:hypothetical protein